MSAERAAFMSMGDSSDFLKKPEKTNASGGNKAKTVRLKLDLFEPDEFKFPEFNYSKLVQIEKKKQKKIAKLPNGTNHNDPFGNGDEGDVERITRELEAKYGAGSAYSKSSKLTTVDRGAGYDISDSFIDDTEAYDELIPDEVETDRGGFYINSGALEFKKLSNFERPGDELIMPKAKKRAFSSSSDSSDSENDGKSPTKSKKKNKAEKKAKIAGTSSSDEQKAKKAKKEKSSIPKEPQKDEKKKESEKSIKTTTVKDMLRAKRDMCLKEQGKSGSGTATTTDNDEDGSESTSSLAVSESSRDSHPENPSVPTNGSNGKEVSLPENLPNDIVQMINSLHKHAALIGNTKANFFEVHVLDKLVAIDTATKPLGATVRMQTFVYLESITPCSRKAIFEKVKKHRESLVITGLKSEVAKLKRIVDQLLPAQIAKHQLDMNCYETQKMLSDSPAQPPKKKFHWNDTTRLVLNDVVVKITELHKFACSKKEILQEFKKKKFEEELLPLWPEGWVKVEDFDKELDKKKRKEAKNQPAIQSLPKNTSTNVTNGKPQTQKTETSKQNEAKQHPIANGKSPTPSVSPSLQVNAAATSVIKKSSDHSISSIIASSTSPSPPMKIPEISKPKVIELDKFSNPSSELLKVTQQPSKMSSGAKRSDSSDSDCIEIVGEFEPSKIQKTSSNHNNNRINKSPTSTSILNVQPQPPKNSKLDPPAKDTNYIDILKGLQSLSDPKKNHVKDSVSSNNRKSETSTHVKSESNGTNDHFLDPNHSPNKSQNNNVNYSISDLIAMSRSGSYDGSVVQGKLKSSDQKSSHFYHHQQQLNSSTNNNLHSISLSLTPPQGHSTSVSSSSTNNSYSMPSILNLSNRK